MELEGTIYCSGPDCNHRSHIGPERFNEVGKLMNLPPGWLHLTEYGSRSDGSHAFCGYDCLMKWAAGHPPEEVIPVDEEANHD